MLIGGISKGALPPDDEYLPNWLVPNVSRWLPLVHRWSPDFPNLEPALVLAVIAQESQGFHLSESTDGHNSIGLMQVIPRVWTGTQNQLREPPYNIYIGMKILDFSRAKWGTRLGLAHYNCSENGVEHDKCGNNGGVHYAERVLSYWLPMFRAELTVMAGEEEGVVGEWLAELGYGTGLGRWDWMERMIRHERKVI